MEKEVRKLISGCLEKFVTKRRDPILKTQKIAGIILAAGDSSRMGEPKALLKIKGKTFIEMIIKNLADTGINPLILVLGHHFHTIKNELSKWDNLVVVQNPNPEAGQLSSLQLAIKNIPPEFDGLIQTLVDHPLVQLSTYKKICALALKHPDRIIIPVYRKKRGHPVYFPNTIFNALLNAPLARGARQVVVNNTDIVDLLQVDDKGILLDIDTPEEYREVRSGLPF